MPRPRERTLLALLIAAHGQPDPQILARLESPDTVASFLHIRRYLASYCGIG